jgi:hypothetical protein
MSIFDICELKSEILSLRTEMMKRDCFIKYLKTHPDMYFYNVKENIYIRKDEFSENFMVYTVVPDKCMLIYRKCYCGRI